MLTFFSVLLEEPLNTSEGEILVWSLSSILFSNPLLLIKLNWSVPRFSVLLKRISVIIEKAAWQHFKCTNFGAIFEIWYDIYTYIRYIYYIYVYIGIYMASWFNSWVRKIPNFKYIYIYLYIYIYIYRYMYTHIWLSGSIPGSGRSAGEG